MRVCVTTSSDVCLCICGARACVCVYVLLLRTHFDILYERIEERRCSSRYKRNAISRDRVFFCHYQKFRIPIANNSRDKTRCLCADFYYFSLILAILGLPDRPIFADDLSRELREFHISRRRRMASFFSFSHYRIGKGAKRGAEGTRIVENPPRYVILS